MLIGGSEADSKTSWDVAVANLGDSRMLLLKKDKTMVELTKDHKPHDTEERNRIKSAGGHVANNRVDGQLALSR